MERLVITWWSGSEWEGNEVVECMYYSSAEALYCDLEEKVKEHLSAYVAFKKGQLIRYTFASF
jgi:hypothetical protein